MFHLTQHKLRRMNNSTEGWHRAFLATVSACHPTIYCFLNVLKCEGSMARVSKLQALGRHPLPPIRQPYVNCNVKIPRVLYNSPNISLFFWWMFYLKITHSENTPLNKSKGLTKSMNMRIFEISTLNQLFKRGSYTETKFSEIWSSSSKSAFFVIGPFCTPYSICLNIVFWQVSFV